ncbi:MULTISPECIES: ArsR/SmtB family transcription factor [Frankia]|uniref:ArsR-family Transcriptional repressor n=1 Tax=Frankia alni (strain DSM 45986 / CECT 9034 / ACN14a) TaxID=326424 RepID=Q0RJP3_FRAAA|nr:MULTISPECIES: metalloregulator ArsR/SmtB family transcription factor [Frankia]CAJ62269.1 putative ArsR-family Transcriptional repressor [Frankia alni ACN14a]
MVKVASQAEVLARFGHALSDPTRARLLLVLRAGGAYPSELAEILGVGRTNLSNHLACLRGCGLVVATPEGRRQRYELADDKLRHALGDLLDVVLAVDTEHVHPAGDAVVAGAAVAPAGSSLAGVGES